MEQVLELILYDNVMNEKTLKIKNPVSGLSLAVISPVVTALVNAHMINSPTADVVRPIQSLKHARYVQTTIVDITE